MYQNFENLSEEKRNKILDACIEEFSKKGYEKASTNEIIKKAGISKGILFHYFGNKKNLFLYVLDYVIDGTLKDFYSETGTMMPVDLFERIVSSATAKLKIAYSKPLVYEFIFKAFINTPDELKDDVNKRYLRLYNEQLPIYFKGLDTSKFKKDIDSQKAMEVILIFADGLYNKYLNMYKNYSADYALSQIDSMMGEMLSYYEILKKGIYECP